MKKLNFIIKCGLALLLLSFYSCESWLNVTPSDRLSEEMLFNDREGFVKALNGVYIELNTNELYGRNLTAGALDVMGQYYSVASSSHAFYNYGGLVYTGNDEKALFDNMWQKCYAVIACCNTIIEKCDERQDVLPGVYYGLYKGEALALRAMLHLDNDITIQYQRISLFPDNLKYIFDILLLIFISAEHGIKIRPIPVFIILSHQIDHPGTQIPAIK